ncbi:MAG: hypothetical protein ACOC85_05480 [Thermoplasmatota archaeon]
MNEEEKDEEMIRRMGYIASRAYYELQDTRKALKNMVRDLVYRKNEGIPFSETLSEGQKKKRKEGYKDKQVEIVLDKLNEEGKLSTDEKRYIDKLREAIDESERYEGMYKKIMGQTISSEPIWYRWLEDVLGIGPVLGAGLVRFFNYCETYPYVSSLWKHSGLHPKGAKGPTKGEKLDYDPDRKTFAWKVMDSFVKWRTEPYRGIYDSEKERQSKRMELKEEGREDEFKGTAPKNGKHVDFRARRKAVKIFLQHYWVISRQLKGLSTEPPYVHDKLKHDNYIKPPHIPGILKPFDPIRPDHWICDKLDECKHPDENCKVKSVKE